jgi:ppGpp synthetase/RelA/SpoT-type nucleotidyltranferase
MQDITDYRAVLRDVEKVKQLYFNLKYSIMNHISKRERDDISNPENSDYRGIHLVYRYNGGKAEYQCLT